MAEMKCETCKKRFVCPCGRCVNKHKLIQVIDVAECKAFNSCVSNCNECKHYEEYNGERR